jgi:hydroxymethylbilane synthase
MDKSYRIGTRISALAIKQAEEILGILKKFYPTLKIEIVGIDTFGDKNKDIPISEIEGTDFFTRELDDALLRGDIDFAVHSAKDLADNLQEGLSIAAVTASIDPYDVLVSKLYLKLNELPYGAKIGTSSLRRKMQLKNYRSDFDIVDIRGTIEERLNRLGKSNLHAIVIAAAGLVRLGLENRITQRIPFEILKPHPLQGALAVVIRAEDIPLLNLLSVADYREAVLS